MYSQAAFVLRLRIEKAHRRPYIAPRKTVRDQQLWRAILAKVPQLALLRQGRPEPPFEDCAQHPDASTRREMRLPCQVRKAPQWRAWTSCRHGTRDLATVVQRVPRAGRALM